MISVIYLINHIDWVDCYFRYITLSTSTVIECQELFFVIHTLVADCGWKNCTFLYSVLKMPDGNGCLDLHQISMDWSTRREYVVYGKRKTGEMKQKLKTAIENPRSISKKIMNKSIKYLFRSNFFNKFLEIYIYLSGCISIKYFLKHGCIFLLFALMFCMDVSLFAL